MAEIQYSDETEEWRDIPGCPGYQASGHGRIKSYHRDPDGAVLTQFPDLRTGYMRVTLRALPGGGRTVKVHRLVCAAFHGPPPQDQPEVAHGDGTRTNNHYSNLRWASRRENVADQIAHGTFKRGCGRKRKKDLTNGREAEISQQ